MSIQLKVLLLASGLPEKPCQKKRNPKVLGSQLIEMNLQWMMGPWIQTPISNSPHDLTWRARWRTSIRKPPSQRSLTEAQSSKTEIETTSSSRGLITWLSRRGTVTSQIRIFVRVSEIWKTNREFSQLVNMLMLVQEAQQNRTQIIWVDIWTKKLKMKATLILIQLMRAVCHKTN